MNQKEFEEGLKGLPEELDRLYGKCWRNMATLDDLTADDLLKNREKQRSDNLINEPTTEPDWYDGEDNGDDGNTCRSCGCDSDLIHDDDGELVCCDCLFEEESYESNQP